MNETRRQKRVASLIKEELSRFLIEVIQDTSSGLITITNVSMSKDLKTAKVYLSMYQHDKESMILETLNKRKGYLRKSIASKIKLKYNPMLIFSIDPLFNYEKKIDEIFNSIKKNEKKRG